MAKKTLGEYIRSLRTKRDIGVRELGRAVDVSGVHISSIEKDKNTPSPELLSKIAVVLGVDIDKLLSMANQVDPEVINVIKNSPSAAPSFLRSAKGLTKAQWEELEKAAIKMTKKKS
jgi:transcriptional regulator with XRE-family HTH domain